MTSRLRYRLEMIVRGLTPFMLTLFLAILTVVPLRIPDFAPITPMFTVIAVYYWSIYRADLLPIGAVFGIGLFQDALAGTPLGLSALVLLAVHYAVISQRRFFHGKTFLVEWSGFMLVAPGAAGLGGLLASLYFATPVAVAPLGFQLLLSAALYPGAAWLFTRIQPYLIRSV